MAAEMEAGGSSDKDSAIMYQDSSQNVFLVEIPMSINMAQHLSASEKAGESPNISRLPRIFSCDPIRAPYSGPSPEPKTATAKSRVLESIPVREREYHSSIAPIINDGLRHLKDRYHGEWCLSRCRVGRDLDGDGEPSELGGVQHGRKRRRTSKDRGTSSIFGLNEPVLSASIPDTSNARHAAAGNSRLPPLILSPGINRFPSLAAIQETVVKNPSSAVAKIQLKQSAEIENEDRTLTEGESISLSIPPSSTFILSRLSPPHATPRHTNIISSISPAPKFDFILADPPWPNRSVRRSAHYRTLLSFDDLKSLIVSIISGNLQQNGGGVVAIWTTNSEKSRDVVYDAFRATGLRVFEEWIWVKMTLTGEPVTVPDGLWRKPYEVLMLGTKDKSRLRSGSESSFDIKRRIIAAVPDIHSRKPNLKEMVEKILFTSDSDVDSEGVATKAQKSRLRKYSALELFARNLTAGWWSCGDEVLRFNWEGWWTTQEDIG